MFTTLRFLAVGIAALWVVPTALAQTLMLDERDAEVWLREQTITGSASAEIEAGVVHVNDAEHPFSTDNGRFAADIVLSEGENVIVACAETVCSDTVRWTLGYELRPEVFAFADVDGSTVSLHGKVLESPNGEIASFAWTPDPSNPSMVSILGAADSVAVVTLTTDAAPGEYYFDLSATDEIGRLGTARTFVSVDSSGVTAFDITSDHADWIDEAIVYEVTPYIFERNGRWRDVTNRLHQIADLGVNTLWIQPVFEAQQEGLGTSGQGYGITDYFDLRDDLGTEEDLRELVRRAKEEFGMRVLFDFVPNHTSIEHPYAQDVLADSTYSHYYEFFLTERDDAPYSQHYKRTPNSPFFNYFWKRLVILDWSNPEVYRWMMEAGRKWIEEFDIDGYRIDAVWGVDARTPEAMQKWRFDLKRYKPEILLLGETPAARDSNFENRYDAAYDWFDEYDWVSHWTWQIDFVENGPIPTVFNHWNPFDRAELLRKSLTNEGRGFHDDAKVFRFMENNDTPRFVRSHNLDQTRMVATLLFSLPGIPMIYNGQEIGARTHPHDADEIFAKGRSIRSLDRDDLFEHYEYLAWLRSSLPVLTHGSFSEVTIANDARRTTFAFRRSLGDVHVIGIVNLVDEAASPELRVPLARMGIESAQTYYLTDLFTGEETQIAGSELRTFQPDVSGFTTKLLAITEEPLEVSVDVDNRAAELPNAIALEQNYPNPFNPSTSIAYELPATQHVTIRVYDMLGRAVATVVDETMSAGRHTVQFNGADLASGVYVYRMESGDRVLTRQMLLIK